MDVAPFEFLGKFQHERNLDRLRALLLRLPCKIRSAVLELDVPRPDVVCVADPTRHVLHEPEPTSRHRAGFAALQELHLILGRPRRGPAFALVRAGDLENRKCLAEASRPAPLVCRLQRLQGVLSSAGLLAARVEDMEKRLLGKIDLHRAKPDLALLHVAGLFEAARAAVDGDLLEIAAGEHHLHGGDIFYPEIVERLRANLDRRLSLIFPALSRRLVGVVELRVSEAFLLP
ncbi:hypothetical protein [Palleronia sp.]|uniref:hypothetical protein n=1 Tax=Palleronia sp. TaxID=1940284 RepID=UPI0035C82628